ncbi:hypothetical protein HK102_003356 [Quaeritorhiza haematococci]|nr:hypothetical protein HK102_003356 [Quaeritorhiza haematococci]
MDLVKVFTAGNKEWNITVKGTHKDPLFRATDVGAILEIKNIYSSMQNFMEGKHWVLQKLETLGGQQNVKFFTKTGLFKIMMRSRTAFAERFQDWVAEVITEIQETGQYQLQKQVDETRAKLLEFQQEKAAIEARAKEAEAAKKEAEAKVAEEQRLREELERKLQKRTYEPIAKTGHVYVIETDGGIKVGKTIKDVSSRVKGMQTANRNDIKILLDFKTSNPDLLERTAHYILDRYRSNSNREFFDCNVEHIKRVVILAGNTIDTLKSMYESISEDEFITKVNENVGLSMGGHRCIDNAIAHSPIPSPPSSPPSSLVKRGRKQKQQCITQFISNRCVFGPDEKVHWRRVWTAYKDWRQSNPDVPGHYDGKQTFFNAIKPKIWSQVGVVKKDSLNIDGDSRDGVLGFGLKE